jgi:hypothetical protein
MEGRHVAFGVACMNRLGSALWHDSRAQHFEGFVLIIAITLILEGMLTFAVLPACGRRPTKPTS